jgi:selenocysteine lyase/cysteine desulfurase
MNSTVADKGGNQGGSRMTALTEEGFFTDDLLKAIRNQFFYVEWDPISGKRTWLESASGSLRLKSALVAFSAQNKFPDQLGRANPSSRHADQIMARGIEDVRLFLGAKSGTIVPAMSSTHAVFRIVDAALASTPGANVVTTNLEHPSVYDSTRQFAEAYGLEWRVATLDPTTGSVPAETILEKVDRKTSLIGMIHGSNITGAILDVKKVAREARKVNPEIFILVDGVQYAPHAPVDVEELGVDAYVFGPYKAFCVKGIGFAYLSDRMAGIKHCALRGKPANDWFLGSAEEATYAAWSAVVDYLCWLGSHFTRSADRRTRIVAGLKASKAHLDALLRRLLWGNDKLAGLMRMDHVALHGVSKNMSDRLCLILFNLNGIDSHRGVELYNRARIRVHNRIPDAYSKHTLESLGLNGGIRLSACHYNTPQEIDKFLVTTRLFARMSTSELSATLGEAQVRGYGEG